MRRSGTDTRQAGGTVDASARNRAVLDAGYAAFDRGDFDTVLTFFAPRIEWVQAEGIPGATTFRGHEQVRGWFEQWGALFEDLSIGAADIVELRPERWIVVVALRGRPQGASRPVEMRFVQTWDFDGDGRVTRVREYVSRRRAMAEAEAD